MPFVEVDHVAADGQPEADAHAVVALAPEHVSAYCLTFEPGTAFAQAALPTAKEDVAGDEVSGKYKPGFFAQADVGTFFTVGGAKGNGNAQLFAGFEFGYAIDIGQGTGAGRVDCVLARADVTPARVFRRL